MEGEASGSDRVAQGRAGVEQGVRSRDSQLGHLCRPVHALATGESVVEYGDCVYWQGHLLRAV